MKIQKVYERLLIVLFLAALVAPVIGTMLGFGPDPAMIRLVEKRPAADPPKIDWSRESIAALPDSIDRYWNDFFGFRQDLVALHGLVRLLLRATVATPSTRREVLIGDEGWLYLANEQEVLRQVRGVDAFASSDLARWVGMVHAWDDWARERGIPFVCAIPPNKHTVYAEHLPAWVRRDRTGANELDQLSEALEEDQSFLDLRPAMFAAKSEERYPVYSRIDSHWNQLGAFFAYRAIIRRLYGGSPPVRVVQRDDLDIAIDTRRGSDLANVLGLQRRLSEPYPYVKVPDVKSRSAFVSASAQARPSRLLVIGDSYSDALLAYFRATFDDVRFVNFSHPDQVSEALRTYTPDVLVIEVVERILNDPAIADRLRRLTPAEPAGGEQPAVAQAAVGHVR